MILRHTDASPALSLLLFLKSMSVSSVRTLKNYLFLLY